MTHHHHDHHHHDHHHTNTTTEPLSNSEFLTQFKDKTLNPVHFKHVGHLRLAWIYLNHYDLETSTQEICTGIKAFAENLGADTKFHLTITDSLVRIVAERIAPMEQPDWQLFLEQNRDLVDDAVSVLLQYFSRDLLFSESARTSLIEPDIKPI